MRRGLRYNLFALLTGTSLALVLISIGLNAVQANADPDPSLIFAEQLRDNCRIQLQVATSNAERTRAQQCIDIQNKVIARLSSLTPPTTTDLATTTSSPPPTTTSPWPTPSNTGVPAGWTPQQVRNTDLWITASGAIVEDVRLTNGADIIVDADDVTIRRVELIGGRINNRPGTTCRKRLHIQQVTIRRPVGTVGSADQEGVVTPGGYYADDVHIDGTIEGFRVGGAPSCSATTIANSHIRILAPDNCVDWHGDGIQGYGGPALIVRNVTIDFQEFNGCGGTAPFFYPRDQGNTSVDIDRLTVKGGGYSFREGMPGRVVNLGIIDAWGYGPINVRCSVITEWQANIVTVDGNWNPTIVRSQPCNTEDGR